MDHQNMSEHVLCMVLYLIELGLDNQVQDNKEDEVRHGGWVGAILRCVAV